MKPLFIRLPPNTTSLSTMSDFSRDLTPYNAKKTTLPSKPLKNSDADIEEIQQKIFENFKIPIENPIFSCPEKTSSNLKKSGFSWFSCKPQQINKFYLESDSIFLTGKVNSKHFYNKIEEGNRSDDDIIREMTGKVKASLKFQNGSILLKDEQKFNVFLKLSDFFIFSSKVFKSIANFRLYFGPDEKLLEPASQFLREKVLDFQSNETPRSEDFIEVKYSSRRGYDWGLSKENMTDFLKNMMKNINKWQLLRCFHLILCSWFEIDDEVLQLAGEFVKKTQNVEIREVSLYFSGAKITDRGTEELFRSIRSVEFVGLKSLAIGFDGRNENIGDDTLKNWIETVLFISQTNYLTNISFCVVSKNISNHGIWCVLEGLQKIAHRLETLTLVFGNDKKLTNGCLKNFKPLMKKAKNLKKLTFGLMSSKIDPQGAQEVLSGVTSLQLLDNFQLYFTNKGSRSKNLEVSFETVLGKMNRKMKERNLQIYLD